MKRSIAIGLVGLLGVSALPAQERRATSGRVLDVARRPWSGASVTLVSNPFPGLVDGTDVVTATIDERALLVEVVDDGAGGADPEGEGLRGLLDRVEALGGALEIDSAAGRGTRVSVRLPLE